MNRVQKAGEGNPPKKKKMLERVPEDLVHLTIRSSIRGVARMGGKVGRENTGGKQGKDEGPPASDAL